MRVILRCCLLTGLPVSVFGLLGIALLLSVTEFSFSVYAAAAAIPILCGCFCAARSAGKHLRRGGMQTGLLCAAVLTGIWYAAVCLCTQQLRMPVLLYAALPCGMLGGIFGVNTKLPRPKPVSHRAIALRAHAALIPGLLHQPPKKSAELFQSGERVEPF